MIHRLETSKLRNVAKFFAYLLSTDALPWHVLSYIRLTEEDTTSSSRIFIKILFQVPKLYFCKIVSCFAPELFLANISSVRVSDKFVFVIFCCVYLLLSKLSCLVFHLSRLGYKIGTVV